MSVRRRGEISHSYSNDYCVGRYYIYLDYSWSLYIWTVSAIRTLHNTECLHHVIPCFVRKSSAVWDGSCKWGSGLEAQAAVAYGSSFILGVNTFVLLFLATDRVYKRFMYVNICQDWDSLHLVRSGFSLVSFLHVNNEKIKIATKSEYSVFYSFNQMFMEDPTIPFLNAQREYQML